MSARLDITHGPSAGTQFRVTPGAPISVGRGSDNGPGKIKDPSISRVHGTFSVVEGTGLQFRDNSRNGTWLVRAGQQTPAATLRKDSDIEEAHMAEGDRIMLGHTTIVVASVSLAPPAAAAAAAASSRGAGSRTGSRRTSRTRRASDVEAEAILSHPFSQLLAAGPPADRGAPPGAPPRARKPDDLPADVLSSVGRAAIGKV
ncbi:hypothetical protein FNF29_04751 [Cafeteria roenbergensis]|uniref:FHA domain-containing protein n=1 Tax=Cafeteria roenbergensis TaxID=33653 RepID=A0A5A8CE62_CAFRO|nr:hypothetical protein FNF29_04751 [Cafeteria roenbergensis]|eukprot:KAA0151276.1 hypothetical protein FNF29_04751 [Cafeteria roenbergensis]